MTGNQGDDVEGALAALISAVEGIGGAYFGEFSLEYWAGVERAEQWCCTVAVTFEATTATASRFWATQRPTRCARQQRRRSAGVLNSSELPSGVVDVVFAIVHPGHVSDDDRAEVMRLRDSIRDHLAMLSGRGKNPLDGVTWSPDADRFDALLRSLATQAGFDAPVLPWANLQRLEVDELCRSAGVLDGLPLSPA